MEFITKMMGGAADAIDDAREEARLNAILNELRQQSKDLKEHTTETGEKTVTAINAHTSEVITKAMGKMKQKSSLELELAMQQQLCVKTEEENASLRQALQAITTPRNSRKRSTRTAPVVVVDAESVVPVKPTAESVKPAAESIKSSRPRNRSPFHQIQVSPATGASPFRSMATELQLAIRKSAERRHAGGSESLDDVLVAGLESIKKGSAGEESSSSDESNCSFNSDFNSPSSKHNNN